MLSLNVCSIFSILWSYYILFLYLKYFFSFSSKYWSILCCYHRWRLFLTIMESEFFFKCRPISWLIFLKIILIDIWKINDDLFIMKHWTVIWKNINFLAISENLNTFQGILCTKKFFSSSYSNLTVDSSVHILIKS